MSARRVVQLVALDPGLTDPAVPAATPSVAGDLVDAEFGVIVRAGRLTAIVTSDPGEGAQIAERLGRYTDRAATLGDVPLRCLTLATVRQLILVADDDARLFAGALGDREAGGHRHRRAPDPDGNRIVLWHDLLPRRP